MSKLTIVFDPHCWSHKRHGGALVKGINRRGALCLDVLRRAIDVANVNDAPLVVAGDLIDSAGPVQPQFAAALRNTLAKCKRPMALLLGNHDMTADGDHSLGIYEQHDDWTDVRVCGGINQISDFAVDLNDVCLVPFHRDIRDERVRDVPLLVAHFGVYDDSFSSWCKRAKGAWHVDALFAFMEERNIKCCLLGDWHSRAIWQTMQPDYTPFKMCHEGESLVLRGEHCIMQGGALSPTGFDNPGLHGYGTVALWDTDKYSLSWQELPGPRFCVARSDEEEASLVGEAQRLGHDLFLRRYYSGERPATPQCPTIEAYEALPIAVETTFKQQERTLYGKHPTTGKPLYYPRDSKDHLQELISEWLEQFDDDKDALEAHVRRYL